MLDNWTIDKQILSDDVHRSPRPARVSENSVPTNLDMDIEMEMEMAQWMEGQPQ